MSNHLSDLYLVVKKQKGIFAADFIISRKCHVVARRNWTFVAVPKVTEHGKIRYS